MTFAFFYHSLISDWNHGNAHFLRGLATELICRGHVVRVFEPENAWSVQNLLAENGPSAIERFHAAYPLLRSQQYDPTSIDLDEALDGVDAVLVHEWNDPSLVKRIGIHRNRRRSYYLFFHDTHHRAVTAPSQMSNYDLQHYNGVLAYGESLRQVYLNNGWATRAWTWHEAADLRVFHPRPHQEPKHDLIWIGNWGDDERTAELNEYLINPAAELHLKTKVHGVRYPQAGLNALAQAGIEHGGWLPNFDVPQAFSESRLTIHIPRGPYVKALKGIPTIRPFEALACGIPLISAHWEDPERLFSPGKDFLVAKNGNEMRRFIKALLNDQEMARELTRNGLETIRNRHTCAHRVDELLGIYRSIKH